MGFGLAQVVLSPPATFRVGGGPYTVPISVTNASRLSTITLTVTFDPALLRVRTVQEGSFMRSGGASAAFTQQVGQGRIDITIVRSADATGATGTGLLAAVLFDAIAPGAATLSVSGAASGPGGTPMGLQFRPAAVTVQQ
jgi:general secretion pathway protein D